MEDAHAPSPIVPPIDQSEIGVIAHAVEQSASPAVIMPHDNPDVDAIVSATTLHHLLAHRNIPSVVCLRTPPDDATMRIIEENGLFFPDDAVIVHGIPESCAPIILTDWFAIPDADETISSRILAVFDHHPTEQGICARIVHEEPYTSATKLIYDLFAASDDTIAGTLRAELVKNTLYTLFVDSNSMKSTRFNPNDLPWIESVIAEYGFDYDHLVDTGYCLNDMSEPVHKLIRNGEKRYNLPNGKRARIAYIMASDYDRSRDDEFASGTMMSLEEGFDCAWFMVCDLGRDETHIYKSRKAGDDAAKGEWVTYHANLSRAKDVYPMLERENLE